MFGICHSWMTTQAYFLASCTNCPRNSFTWSTSSTDANWWRDFDGSSPSNPIQNIKLRNHFHKSPNLLSLSSTNALYFIWCLFYFTSNSLFFQISLCWDGQLHTSIGNHNPLWNKSVPATLQHACTLIFGSNTLSLLSM